MAVTNKAFTITIALLAQNYQNIIPSRKGKLMKTILIIIFITLSSQGISNQRIQTQIRYWETTKRLAPSIKRASQYAGVVMPIIKGYGLPERMILLPILESGYRCGAKSSAGALGCWQFMSRTGDQYGLGKTAWGDSRKDIVKSTIAASKYLKQLHNKYDDWALALAAYNYGQGRLDKVMRQEKTKDYWALEKIPKETKEYVPKFLALVEIGILGRIKKVELIKVRINGIQSLRRIAGILRIKTRSLSDINHIFSNGNTPPGVTIIYLSPDWNRAGLCAIQIADC